MKKVLKNKKGFTLVELLAVIVVLAVIMVIATQSINKTIKKSRADSFVSSYKIVLDAIDLCAAQNIGVTQCAKTVELSEADYEMTLTESSGEYIITLKAKIGGQFYNMGLSDYYKAEGDTAPENAEMEELKYATVVTANTLKAKYSPTSLD